MQVVLQIFLVDILDNPILCFDELLRTFLLPCSNFPALLPSYPLTVFSVDLFGIYLVLFQIVLEIKNEIKSQSIRHKELA